MKWLFRNVVTTSVIVLLSTYILNAQNVILDPNGDGGFENGASFSANGWTVLNGTEPNYWILSNAPSGTTGNRCAHITDDGSSFNYDITGGTDVHFYRSIDRSPYTNTIMLEFDWIGIGEAGYDALTVGFTGSGSCCSDGSGIYNPKTILLDQIGGQSTWKTESIDITGVSTAHDKLVFYWEGGTTSGTQPPHAIDNIYMYEVTSVPVEMEYFESRLEETTPVLKWKPTPGDLFSYFEVQRSSDNVRFTTIGKVFPDEKTQSGEYVFTDPDLLPNNYLYRLKAIKSNHKFSFTRKVSVNISPEREHIEVIYPNPVKTKTRMTFVSLESKERQVSLFDASGELVKEISFPIHKGTNYLILDLFDIMPGIYQVQIGNQIQKLIKE